MSNFESKLESGENEEERLERARQELKDFQAAEKSRKEKTVHLIGTANRPDVDLDKLTDEDLKMWLRLNEFTEEEFKQYRQRIPSNDYNRQEFAAFLANKFFIRLAKEKMKKISRSK